MTNASMVGPRLPQDLERTIFEIAAHDERRKIPQLMRIALRVHAWLKPILYSIVILNATPIAGKTADLEFYTRPRPVAFRPHQTIHIRHLLLYSDCENSHWDEFIPHCHNLRCLALWSLNAPKTVLQDLTSIIRSPLRTVSPRGLVRLSAELLDLFPERIDFNHEVLRDITHLDVLDSQAALGQWQEGNNFACLKNLRFLSFVGFSSVSNEILERCLDECDSLNLIVMLNAKEDTPFQRIRRKARLDGTVEETLEDRVVCLSTPNGGWVEDWFREATWDDGFWSEAERILRRAVCTGNPSVVSVE